MENTPDMSQKAAQSEYAALYTEIRRIADQKEKGLVTLAEHAERTEKLEKSIEKYDIAYEANTKKAMLAEKRVEDVEKQLDELSRNTHRLGAEGNLTKAAAESAQHMALQLQYFKASSDRAFDPKRELAVGVDKKYLRTDNNPDGGYLVVPEMSDDIVKKLSEINPVRQIARVRTTTSNQFRQVTRSSAPQARWEGEAQETSTSQSRYGIQLINVMKLMVEVPITIEQLADSSFNMEMEINEDVAEAFALKESQDFLNGDGILQPKGLLVEQGVQVIAADSFNPDSLIDITGELKAGYNPVYLFNRRTLVKIRQFKDSENRYIWTPDFSKADAPTIQGERYVIMNDMPDVPNPLTPGASSTPILYGDFNKAYTIVDKMGLSVERDESRQRDRDIVEFHFRKRTGAGVILKEAYKKLTVTIPV